MSTVVGIGEMTSLRQDLERQRDFMVEQCPVYGSLLERTLQALDGVLGQRLLDAWSTRTFTGWYARPLLYLAALRNAALAEGHGHPLSTFIGEDSRESDVPRDALNAATRTERSLFWEALRTRAVQTNETSRVVVWWWPASLVKQVNSALELQLVDVGASAGLNLVGEELPDIWSTSDGRGLVLRRDLVISKRTGFDLNPLDVRNEDEARWLRACVWPGQTDRANRLEDSIAAFLRSGDTPTGPRLLQRSAARVPDELAAAGRHQVVLAYQSLVDEYLPAPERDAYVSGMRTWLRESVPARAVWLRLEAAPGWTDADGADKYCALTAEWQSAERQPMERVLARSHPHPRTLLVDRDAEREFSAAFE